MIEMSKLTIAIAATFTAELIEEPLAYWMQELGIQSRIEFASYNQVFQQLLDPLSLFSKNDKGINVVLIRLEDWQRYEDSSTANVDFSSGEYEKIKQNVQDLILALKSAAKRSGAPCIVCLCPASLAIMENTDHSAFFEQMEELMASELNDTRGVYLVTTSELSTAYPVSQYNDPFTDQIGHIPYTPTFFTSLATMIARRIFALRSKPYKVIVLDCDQTLWNGICGEDGPDGIEINTPYQALQEFMVGQHNVGILLCLCSKNNEEDVVRVFDHHPRMLLRRDHIVSWRINWKSKSENIRSLADELQLGLDSFIFIDDNPIECAQVQAECPEVLTLQLPQEPDDIPRFFDHVWAFDHLKVTEEDKERTKLYKQNIKRSQFQKETLTFHNFLAGLELKVNISEMSDSQIARVAQLTQRTNQFNFTTIRRSEAEIQKLCQSEELERLVVEVSDRFGDYGLVGVIMFRTNGKALEVDTFLLSCRVLGRGVEHQMIRKLGEIANERGGSRIDVHYIPTGRNQPSFDFLNGISAEFKYPLDDGCLFKFPVEFAELLTYEPDSAESEPQKQSVSASPDTVLAAEVQWNSALLSRIATELYDAEQVLESVRAQKFKSQKPESLCYQVEQTLREHTAVRQIVVRIRDDTPDRKRLVAYVVADRKSSPTISGHLRYLLPNNMAIVHQNTIETDVMYKEMFEDQIYLNHGIVINEGDCVFDVGANIGMFTLFVQQVCKNTRIYAFEPAPQLCEMLRINAALYCSNVEFFNCGLSDENKSMTLTFYPHVTTQSGYYPDAEIAEKSNIIVLSRQAQGLIEEDMLNKYMDEMLERASITENVATQLTTLSDILIQSDIERINLLKIDVERSELDVLAGVNEQDWEKIDQIVMEVHNKDLLDKVTFLLKGNGYHIVVDQQPLLKGTEYFMLYAIQQQSQDPALSRKKHKLTRNRPLPTLSTHLLSGEELRGFLKKKISRLTMPLDIMFLDTLPLSANGELNNQALPVPNRSNSDLDRSSAEPLTFIEKSVCRIWEEILGINQVSIYDNFFELGGHSLLATQIMSRIRDTFEVELSFRSFFDAPTIADTSVIITESKRQSMEANNSEVAKLLKELDQLSENQAKMILDKETLSQSNIQSSLVGNNKAMQLVHKATCSGETANTVTSEYYRCADIERFTVGDNLELVYSRSNCATQILQSDTIDLLYRCQRFQTLEDHARNICHEPEIAQRKVEAIRNQLLELADTGFLISQKSLLDHCARSVEFQEAPAEIASVALLTYNQIDTLKRGLVSYIKNSKQFARTNDFVVMVDSENTDIRNSYQQMLHSLKNDCGVEIYYAGLEEKVRFANKLIKGGDLPPEVVNFALFDVENIGFSNGANRNAVLLHTVGDTIFSTDDDTVCRITAPPSSEEGLAFTSGCDPAQCWFFPDRQTTLQSVNFVEEDVLAFHERFLGKSLGSIVSALKGMAKLNFNQIESEFLRRLGNGSGKVQVTFNGVIGDCAWGAPFGLWGDPIGYLLLDDKSHARLVKSESEYRSACTSRELFRIVSCPTISDETFSQTTFVGLDNQHLLPPFFPVRRGMDKIFGITLWKCFDEAYFCHLPQALLHAPAKDRRFWPGEITRSASGFDIDKVIIECIKSLEFGPGKKDGKERLRALGKHLMELGSILLADFAEFVKTQAWKTNSQFISLMEEHLCLRGESPDYWSNDIKKYISILRQSMVRKDYWVPLDLLEGRTIDEVRELTQRLVFNYGQLLYWWPEIVEVSKNLRTQGQRLAKPV